MPWDPEGFTRMLSAWGQAESRGGENVMSLTTSDGFHLGLQTDRLDMTWPNGLIKQDMGYIN